MDKAAIFAKITQRNALRRAHGLPSLDISSEFEHQVAVAAQRDYRALCDKHADAREAIRQEVLADYRTRFGVQFGNSSGGRWAVGEVTRKRFATYMAEKHGVSTNGAGSARNTVRYGGAKKDAK